MSMPVLSPGGLPVLHPGDVLFLEIPSVDRNAVLTISHRDNYIMGSFVCILKVTVVNDSAIRK